MIQFPKEHRQARETDIPMSQEPPSAMASWDIWSTSLHPWPMCHSPLLQFWAILSPLENPAMKLDQARVFLNQRLESPWNMQKSLSLQLKKPCCSSVGGRQEKPIYLSLWSWDLKKRGTLCVSWIVLPFLRQANVRIWSISTYLWFQNKIMKLQYFPQIIDTLSMTFVAKQKWHVFNSIKLVFLVNHFNLIVCQYYVNFAL